MGLELLIFYPGLLDLTCDRCQTLYYRYYPEPQRGQNADDVLITYAKPVMRGRPPEHAKKEHEGLCPCSRCPKKNPIQGREIEKNLPQAMLVLDAYNQVKGSSGKALSDEPDALFVRNMGIVEQMLEEKRQSTLAQALSTFITVTAANAAARI